MMSDIVEGTNLRRCNGCDLVPHFVIKGNPLVGDRPSTSYIFESKLCLSIVACNRRIEYTERSWWSLLQLNQTKVLRFYLKVV